MSDPLERLSAALADRYRLGRKLGQGGMATVYLAEDLKHDRKVALKVLKPELAAVLGAERFVVEIKTTAALQHPHILPLFDSGTADGFLYYVMPYVEGETIRDRLNRETQLGIDEAVKIACEIADALDYAHRHGVIHRDIKPENILLHDGRPMVADSGIALALSAAAGGRMTETGLSLGTPHYMSPEQATAEKDLTGRSDVYSLASVLYEMLAGDPPHTGASAQQIIMKIVTETAAPVTKVRKSVPQYVADTLARALEKLPADRFATAHDFAEALQGRGGALPAGTTARGGVVAQAGWRARLRDPLLAGMALVAVAAVGTALVESRRGEAAAAAAPPVRFVMATSDSTRAYDQYPWPAAISPDGDMVAYSVVDAGRNTNLYLLRTDQLEPRRIPETTNAYQPIFSPDGKWLAFGIDRFIRKVRLDGGAPVTITNVVSAANGMDWTTGDELVLGAQSGLHGLSRVSVAGGEPVEFTRVDSTGNERDHLWPIAVPGGKSVVFTVWSGSLLSSRLAIASLDGGAVARLDLPGIRALAVLDGKLVYLQADGAVRAVGLDAGGRKLRGRPVPVHDPVPVARANNGNSGIFVSRGGALVVSRGGTRGKLAWMGLDGRQEPLLPGSRRFDLPRLSPDGRQVAMVVQEGSKSDAWVYDQTLATLSRVTSMGSVTSAEWSPDGTRIVFSAGGQKERQAVWSQVASGASAPQLLYESPLLTPLAAMSPDGKSLLITSLTGAGWDIQRVALDSGAVARPYLTGAADEMAPAFSPDGRWVAVTSEESGRQEVFVRSFPEASSRLQVSSTGGDQPVWSRDGKRLYYTAGRALMVARVALSPAFSLLGRDTVLADAGLMGTYYFGAMYDVSRDGRRILGALAGPSDFDLVVAPNWLTEFRRRLAETGGR